MGLTQRRIVICDKIHNMQKLCFDCVSVFFKQFVRGILFVVYDFCHISATYSTPEINVITRYKGPVSGGTLVTFVGTGLDIIPVIGAYFYDTEKSELPELMGYLLNGSV